MAEGTVGRYCSAEAYASHRGPTANTGASVNTSVLTVLTCVTIFFVCLFVERKQKKKTYACCS